MDATGKADDTPELIGDAQQTESTKPTDEISTDFDDLCGRFESLKEKFSSASIGWPNFQSVLITWPEDKPESESLPVELDGQNAVPVPAPEGEAHFVAMLTGSKRLDTPAVRYRKGRAGMLIYRRSFGNFWGNPQEITDPDQEEACNDRYKVLAEEGAVLLKNVVRKSVCLKTL